MTYWVFKDKVGDWRWQLEATNGKIIADSGEGYKNKADCLAGIQLVKGSSAVPVKDRP